MRKLVVSMNITLDGFIAGTHCELDWHFNSWTSKMAESLTRQLSRADAIVLGRVTYCAMAGFWTSKCNDLGLPREDIAFAGLINSSRKIVFSKTLQQTHWQNSAIIRGDLRKEINKIKKQPGRDLIVYGSGTLVHALMQFDLVDEYSLWVHPVLLGKGKPFCNGQAPTLAMDLLSTETFSSGVVKMDFHRAVRYADDSDNTFAPRNESVEVTQRPQRAEEDAKPCARRGP